MPPARDDLRLLLISGAAVVLAGLFVGALLLVSTDRQGGGTPDEPEPFKAGRAEDIEESLREEGPYYYADPFGGDDSIVFALEDGEVVPLAVNQSDMRDCSVKWKAQLEKFVCGDERFDSTDLERFEATVPAAGDDEGVLIIDVRTRLPAPEMSAG